MAVLRAPRTKCRRSTRTIPINLDTVNRLYGLNLTSFQLKFFAKVAEPKEYIRTSEDGGKQVGRELYEFFRGYVSNGALTV